MLLGIFLYDALSFASGREFRSPRPYKLIWIDGAYRYQNPDNDLPADWETSRESRYLQL